MKQILSILMALLLASATRAEPLEEKSLPELEQRMEDIDARLAQLANYSLGSGIGVIGYRSISHDTADIREWIEIDFQHEVPLDEVILVPAIRRDTENGFQADAFPGHFRLVAGTPDDTTGQVVAEYTGNQNILPRIAPFIIPCGGITASWIRIETEELSLRAFDERYVFQLSEVMAFSAEENVALHKPIDASTSTGDTNPGWNERFLVDGRVPYLMDAAQGRKSVAYLTPATVDPLVSFDIDLGQSFPVNRIRLHAVDQSDTLPQAFAGDFGVPMHMTVEGANQSDFSDAIQLLDLRHETLYDTGAIMVHSFRETPCRYIRLKVIEPFPAARYGKLLPQTGFAEIEVFSTGRNVAVGKIFTTSFTQGTHDRPLSSLTDGLNMYGNILPVSDWMKQLALRHDLEAERPLVQKELNRRYARQKANLRRMGWLMGLLLTGTVIIILLNLIIHQRAVFRTRERIAADLHDELGANLHAIGLLGDLAQASKSAPEKLDRLLQRMRALTERTGAAARYCTNLLEAKGLYEDLVEDMRRTSARIAADLDHSIEFSGEALLAQLKPRKRIDLFLFYKECLINIIRHSGATRVGTRLTIDRHELNLTIEDNGHGLNGEVPASLKRRARFMGAHVSSGKSTVGGTRISLKLKPKKFGVFK
jgi:signal transduction histidine kinase